MTVSNVIDNSTDTGPTIAPAAIPAPATVLWRRLSLLGIFLLGLALRLWGLAQNGWGNEYYTAGVRSMTLSWHNFLYNSFDPAGFVAVDKPPVALWVQALSAKLFGFHGLALLVPQVLEGMASMWIVYHLVKRRFGESAGLVAALFLAITPISVAIDRSNNTDSCLVLVLLLAAWALIRAAEEGSRRLFLLSMIIIGVGFNVKMLAAFVVLPTFVLVYFVGAPLSLRRRFADLAVGGVVLVCVSLSWVLVYDLTPSERRPFAGTTKGNSMLELAVGPYAVGRFVPPVKTPVSPESDSRPKRGAGVAVQSGVGTETPVKDRYISTFRRLFVRAPSGPLRFADGQLAAQVGWLFPFAIMGVVFGTLACRPRQALAPKHLSLLLWTCWTVTYGAVYSYAGGIMHLYYLATMAPPLAALAGVGAIALWERYTQKGRVALLLPATLILTAVWQLHVEASAFDRQIGELLAAFKQPDWNWLTWLHASLIGGTCAAAAVLLVLLICQTWRRTHRVLAAGAIGIGLASLLVLPTAWALSSVLVPGHGILPSADLARLVPMTGNRPTHLWTGSGKPKDISKLAAFLKANRQGERFLLATSSARLAAPIIISTGEPVMAIGGFHGLDPIVGPKMLARMVEMHEVRFVMQGDLSVVSRRLGAEAAMRPIAEWVQAHGKIVGPALWRSYHGGEAGLSLYDLRPEVALVPAPL